MTPQELYQNKRGGLLGPCRICERSVHQGDNFVVTGGDIRICLPCYEERISKSAT
jgi:ribosome-binding protein aMBF1 (putative translation factor)